MGNGSTNPFFGYAGRTYNDPVHTDEFIAAKTMYLAAGKRYDSERVQDMVTRHSSICAPTFESTPTGTR